MLRIARAAVSLAASLVVAVAPPLAPVAAATVASATLTSSVGNGLDGFANSVATSGDIVAVGAPHHDAGGDVNSDEGAVFVYERGPSGWTTGTEIAVLTASDAETRDQLGWAVAISGDVIAASAIRANGGAGAVYVFVKPAGGWASMTETAYLRSSTGDFLDLGWSLALSGDTVVAGAPSYDVGLKDDVGAALVFEKPAGGWGPRSAGDVTETKFLTLPTPATHGQLGFSVSASGDTVVLGSPGEGPFQGAAYVYQADLAIGWSTITLLARLSASDGDWNDAFGYSVAVHGRLVAIGAPCDDDLAGTTCSGAAGEHSWGSVYIFREPFTGWVSTTQLARLHAATPHAFESLGFSVAVDDDGVYAGAPGWPTGSSFSGRVYRFVQPAGGWSDGTEASVEYQAKERFGKALAAAGHTLAIGDSSGNHGGEVTVEVTDAIAPTTTIGVTPDVPDGSGGWYATAPTVSVAASDPAGSGVAAIRCMVDPASVPASFADLPASCPFAEPGASLATDGAHTIYAASVDVAGNASEVVSASVDIDASAPTTTIDLAPSTPGGADGWYTQPVDVLVSASDAVSGVAETRCALDPVSVPASFADLAAGCAYGAPGTSLGTDGVHVVYAASTDAGGSVEAIVSATASIDTTDPDLTCRAASFTLGGSGAVIADVTDATSGPASDTASAAADTTSVGAKTASISGSDLAGNTATTSCPYTVGYEVIGPIGLKSTYRVGTVAPVRVALATADGVRIPDATATSIAGDCGVLVSILGDAWSCATYNARTDEFVVPQKIARTQSPGLTTVVIEVRAGSVVVNTIEATITLR
jgi:hypothetical protein